MKLRSIFILLLLIGIGGGVFFVLQSQPKIAQQEIVKTIPFPDSE